jgi:hypothetical protein
MQHAGCVYYDHVRAVPVLHANVDLSGIETARRVTL